MTTLTFLGAIDTVTGSRYLVDTGRSRVLVDCGLFQGPKKLRERNWATPSFDIRKLDAVVLTHAHIDHAGYLPRLCAAGFAGPVYCTRGTRDLLGLLLPDAGYLNEEEARHANRVGYTSHQPALPLYTREDAERCLAQLHPIEFHERFNPTPDVHVTFGRAGHIIGSAWVVMEAGGTSIAFTGDVGRPVDPIMKPPEPIAAARYLVVESTYGDRLHPPEAVADLLAKVIHETFARGGTLLVPSFAVGRAQHLLHLLEELRVAGRIPACPVFLDSPMAIDATQLFYKHVGDHALTRDACAAMCRGVRYTRGVDESKAIATHQGPMIVIAASGMCTGGRVLHHLRTFLPDERATILFVGFQSAGTRGRSLVDGATEIKLFGEYVPVRAHVARIDALSAHADYAEMIAWLRTSTIAPREA
ncbi:MAG: MBL fold metallo-hydrolase, partial [Proteobacteria bacterium]|nr:MBL fold metallo-hydrolase [Pseudomonadota bacterium]